MKKIETVTQAQVRAARSLLGITAEELAALANVGVATVRRFESAPADGEGRGPHSATLKALQGALETAGVEFIAENGGGAGVRLAKRSESNG